ncbi:hypothetical protein [Brevundimonas faecalis]|uniref:3',5'-cyclic-nucleotide phosphodiesterase n=1 Tax=Brevundimonas faecalis TaxID=947378 RepID=A0ABV2R8D2_9CAUL
MSGSIIRRLALGAVVLAAAGLTAAVTPGASPAEAQGLSQYDMCMLNAYYDCYPRDSSGQPRPPNLGDMDEAAAFEQCVAASYPRCAGLPGDPN